MNEEIITKYKYKLNYTMIQLLYENNTIDIKK